MSEPEKRPETEPGSRSPVGEGLTLAVFVALLFPACMVCLFWFGTAFSTLPFNLLPGLPGLAGLAGAALLFAVTTIPGDGRWRPCLQKASKAVAVLSLVVLAVALGWNTYRESLTIRQYPHIDTSLYRPFSESSRIARLEGEAALRFSGEDKAPILDGEASLFPLCAAMVNATYPAEDFPDYMGGKIAGPYFNTMGYYRSLGIEEVDIFFDSAPSNGAGFYYGEWDTPSWELEALLLGGQGLVFFTHADNPVEGLTRDQLRGIYAGEITNWAQVGGADTPILPYQRHGNSVIQAALVRFMGDTPLGQAPTEERRYLSGHGGEYLADYRNSPGAIGFTFSAYAPQLLEEYHIKLLAVDGVYPDGEAIGRGDYPVTDPIYMVLRREEHTEEMDRFIAWALGPEGQELVARSGYAPVAKIEQ